MNRPDIVFVISSLSAGGAERVLSVLANELINDFEITIVVYYKGEIFYTLDPRIEVVSCRNTSPTNFGGFRSIFNNLRLLYSIVKILNKKRADIVIGFMTTSNILSVIASKFVHIPSIISVRNHPEFRKINGFWSFMRDKFYRKASKIVVQTKDIQDFFIQNVPESNLIIIKNPISSELAKLRSLGQKKENIILNVGRLEDQKNQNLLIDAFSELNLTDWRIQFIGEGSNKSRYLQKTKELNLEDNISFIGNVKNIEAFYNTAKIFVFTSNYEGFPNALTEALYFGIPSISTNCPSGPSELIENGKNGLLIPMGDLKALQQAITKLVEDDDLRTTFSKQAVESTKQYEAQIIANQWQNVITELLNE